VNTFSLQLQDARHAERFDNVVSFVGEDTSGSFGVLANHARLMAVLNFGLARFRILNRDWTYVAMPGAVLYFRDNELTLNTRRYVLDDDYLRISDTMQRQLVAEEEKLLELKQSLHQMEEEVLRRMWEMRRGAVG